MVDLSKNDGGGLSPAPLMELATGFWASKTVAAGVELGLFTRLAGGRSVSIEEAATEFGIKIRPASIFLAASVALGLLEKDGEKYRNSPLAEEFLVAGRPSYFGGYITFLDRREYLPWHDVVHALRTDRPVTWDPDAKDSLFTREDPMMMQHFWEAMHSVGYSTARALGAAHDFGSHTRLLDVGGGSGVYSIELCKRYPHLTATVFDLAHVCDIAAAKISESGLDGVVDTVAGDFQEDAVLPGGYDVILLSSVLHNWDEQANRELLRKCWEALPSNGAVVICELLLDSSRTGSPAAALMGMNMLVETERGMNYSGAEYASWLTDAGFGGISTTPFDAPHGNAALVARKP
ncbi:methyltransferase [Streptomyces flaveolus]|uniref:methyltransferase n=1 Tax=Streptomyces flaveolus TaxID=67297 RepID=UPI0036F51EA4